MQHLAPCDVTCHAGTTGSGNCYFYANCGFRPGAPIGSIVAKREPPRFLQDSSEPCAECQDDHMRHSTAPRAFHAVRALPDIPARAPYVTARLGAFVHPSAMSPNLQTVGSSPTGPTRLAGVLLHGGVWVPEKPS